MLKALTQEQIDLIIDKATEAFADKGFAGAKISGIAKEAGVSVGVIYKYYEDKEALFTACVEKCLGYLDEVFEETAEKDGGIMEMVSELIRKNQEAAKAHPEYFRLYHQITVKSPGDAAGIAEMIEGRSARLYTRLIEKAAEDGEVRDDIDPALFAFFFDDLMMMLHFAYATEYYEERFRVYCGDGVTDRDEEVRGQLMRFIAGALGAADPEVTGKEGK